MQLSSSLYLSPTSRRDVSTRVCVHAFDRLDAHERAGMLGRLLASMGPLALAVVGGGAFAKYVKEARHPQVPVSMEDASRTTLSQVSELVDYVQQSNPQSLSALFADKS